jgi:predicted protein tyrosine phosphatase
MSSIPRLHIASYQLAEGLLSSPVAARITHVVSINDPETGPPRDLEGHPGQHLVLHFHDVPAPGHGWTVPSREHVQKILQFADQLDERHEVLVHCAAGISRSSAAALAIIASKLEPSPRSGLEAVRRVMNVKKSIYPNTLMVEFTDGILGYRGTLMSAHRSTFGEPFVIPGLEEADAFFEDAEDPLDP